MKGGGGGGTKSIYIVLTPVLTGFSHIEGGGHESCLGSFDKGA